MAKGTRIEWTDHTANFWWGCVKVSPGCKNCYADTWATRWGKDIWGPAATTSREPKKSVWANVRAWNREAEESGERRRVFCMSMGDFFEDHPQVEPIRDKALEVISACKHLDWQILTKRPENVNDMIEDSPAAIWGNAEIWFSENPHVWIGTSVENQEQADKRIPELLNIPARVRFLSMEPLLGPVDLGDFMPLEWAEDHGGMAGDFSAGIDWVIVGGESGRQARPMHPDWARSIRDQCVEAGVPFFFKQWGEFAPVHELDAGREGVKGKQWVNLDPDTAVCRIGKEAAGRMLDGREWNEMPAAL